MTGPQQEGGSFSLTGTDLERARQDYDAAADEVRREFSDLVSAVLANPSRGDAFTAAHTVAERLQAKATEFETMVRDLAANVSDSAREYQNLNTTGAERISRVAEQVEAAGATYSRLVPRA